MTTLKMAARETGFYGCSVGIAQGLFLIFSITSFANRINPRAKPKKTSW